MCRRQRWKTRLDIGDDLFGLFRAAVRNQPSWALRNPETHEKNQAGQTGANQESESPAEIRVDHLRIKQNQGPKSANGCANPEAPVDDEVVPSADARGNKLLDGGIDRGIFAANSSAGQETKKCEARKVPGERCRCSCRQVNGKRQKKHPLATQPIGQPAEKNCTKHRSGEIGAARKSDVGIRKTKRRAFFQRTGQAACKRHFKAVEDPCDAEGDNDKSMETSPRQPVKSRRDVSCRLMVVLCHGADDLSGTRNSSRGWPRMPAMAGST